MYSEEYNEKVKLFKDAISFKKPKSIPNLSNFFTWKISDSEFTFKESLYDFNKMEKLTCDFHERYNFDAYMDLGTRNPLAITDALGGGFHIFDEKTDSINAYDHVLMSAEEYKDFANDPLAFSKILFERKFPNVGAKEMLESISAYLAFGQFAQNMTDKFTNEYNRPAVFDMTAAILTPYEFFNSAARGIKELSLDVRRHQQQLIEAMDVYYELFTKNAIDVALASDSSMYVTDIYTALLGYSMLNIKQFEKVYWPILKKYIDKVVEQDKTIYIFCESTMLRFAEFFSDIPKGHVVLHLELDDIFEARKRMPNMCLAGGMNTELLGYGTPEQCVDQAKRLIEELEEGFILSQNKMMSFKNDCKRENLLAVNDFVKNYRL